MRSPGAFLSLGLWLALAGCAAPGGPGEPLVLGSKDNDKVVRAEQGRVIEIRLPAAGGDGPRWDIDRIDAGVLTPVGPPRFEPAAAGAVDGTMIFRFKAARLGNGLVRLVYRQPWEPAVKGDTFLVVIQVR